jgi:Predicted membrane protein
MPGFIKKHSANKKTYEIPPGFSKLTYTLAQTAVFSGLAIALSFIEGLFPPIAFFPPGAKIGLSNTAVMFSALKISFFSAIFTAVIKSCFVLITRGITAFLLSLSGSLLSALITAFFIRFKPGRKFSFIGIGIIGGVCHNLGQFIMAFILMGKSIIFYLPYLLITGVITGALTGTLFRFVLNKLKYSFK